MNTNNPKDWRALMIPTALFVIAIFLAVILTRPCGTADAMAWSDIQRTAC